MVWKSSDCKLAIIQMRNKFRSIVEELFKAIGNEETRLARMELDGRLERATARVDRNEIR
jgi:hypothetical protein